MTLQQEHEESDFLVLTQHRQVSNEQKYPRMLTDLCLNANRSVECDKTCGIIYYMKTI